MERWPTMTAVDPPKLQRRREEQTKQFRNLNILFVDDDPAFSKPIALVLHKGFGHNTKLVTSMLQVYTEIQRSNFDIILLDYKLADGSGLEVLHWMKDHSVDIPVILITGYGCEEVAVEAMKLGAYDYVNKMHISFDFIPNLIHSTVERHLVIKQQRQRNTAIQAFQNAVESSLFLIKQSGGKHSIETDGIQRGLSERRNFGRASRDNLECDRTGNSNYERDHRLAERPERVALAGAIGRTSAFPASK